MGWCRGVAFQVSTRLRVSVSQVSSQLKGSTPDMLLSLNSSDRLITAKDIRDLASLAAFSWKWLHRCASVMRLKSRLQTICIHECLFSWWPGILHTLSLRISLSLTYTSVSIPVLTAIPNSYIGHYLTRHYQLSTFFSTCSTDTICFSPFTHLSLPVL